MLNRLNTERLSLKKQNLALKERKQKAKERKQEEQILMLNLSTIHDLNVRAYMKV